MASEPTPATLGPPERELAPALLDALFAAVPAGLAVWDTAARFRRVNDVLAEMDGSAAEDHVGRSLPDVLGSLGERLEPVVRGVLETGQPAEQLELGDHDRSWLATITPVRGADGAVVAALGAATEITGERRAIASAERSAGAARTASALVDAIFGAAPIGLAFWGTDLRYQRVNAALAEMNGRSAADHVGRTVHDVLGVHGERVAALMQLALTSGEPAVDVAFTSGPSHATAGDERFWEASYFPVPGPAGQPVGVGGIVRDVTERKRAERERDDLLQQALTSRAVAEAAQMRVEEALREAEEARAEAEAARRRTDFLARAGMRLAASMDYERTLGEVVRSAVPEIADWCAITLRRSDGELETVAAAHHDAERERIVREVTSRYPPQPNDPVGAPRVIRTGQIELLEDISGADLDALARDREHALLLRALGLRTSLVVPLRARGRTLGALTLVLGDPTRRFGDADVTLARALAARAALHLDNARLYSERSHIARTLQRSLLPASLPSVPGLDVAARYRAAGDENEVGGDFYDMLPLGDTTWKALIGDVAGKGPEAAAVTSLARHTLRAAAVQGLGPADSLVFLNTALLAAGETARVLTAACVRIDVSDGGADLTLAVAGHPPPLVQRADGTVEEAAPKGMILGAVADVRIEEARLRLGPGDLLLLCTDGVTEVRGADPLVGVRALSAVLERTADHDAAAVLREVERSALGLHAGGPRDDMALLAVRVATAL